MLAPLTDPLILLILALLLAQSLVYLIGGLRAQRRPALSKSAEARARRELAEWGLPPDAPTLRAWARLMAQGRVGMSAGILGAVLLLLALLSIPGSADLLNNGLPPLLLVALLLLQAFSLGMFAGQAAALLLGLSRLGRAAPTNAGEPVRHRARSEYRSRQVAVLPGGLLVGDMLLLGLLERFAGPGLAPAAVWSVVILPAVMALVCISGEYAMRRVARLPALPLSSDPTLARRADGALRAHLMGMLLELEVFGLFLLVSSQWMLNAFAAASSGLASGALLVYAVILLSLRGLLARSQRERMLERQQLSQGEQAG